jgi:hypothetical protein
VYEMKKCEDMVYLYRFGGRREAESSLKVVLSPHRVGLYLQLRKGAKFTRVLHYEVKNSSRLVRKLDSSQILSKVLILLFSILK